MAKPDNTLKRKEREEKEDAEDGLKFVIDGAKLKCDLCTVPEGDLKVNFDTPTIQDKKVATVVEKDMKSLIFKGNCKKSPNSSSPCASVMKLADWKDVGTVYFQDQFPLLLKSTIKCEYGGVEITITDSAQRNEIEKIDTTGAPVPSVEKTACFCNRDFTDAEVTYIITQLRKKDDVHQEQQYHGKDPKYITKKGLELVKMGKEYYDLKGNKFLEKETPEKYKKSVSKFDELGFSIFQSKRSEKIKEKDATISIFTKEINKTLKEYKINTCLRKIHFLAQCYVESGRLVDTYEGLTTVPDKYKGGVDFQGRGLKQITHDMNYLQYYDKVNGTTLFKDKYKGRNNPGEGLTSYMKRITKNGFPKDFLNTLKTFAKKLSTELHYACDSAGWFWDKEDLNEVADEDNVTKVTKIINGGDNGLPERKKYTADLKIIFDYEKCSSKK